ncbi:MAG: UPF0175 family protein [Candidatus Diapherotrites archaeon]|nr:UPF0175 family protein [Candidatus Diapherotrites archaeon]
MKQLTSLRLNAQDTRKAKELAGLLRFDHSVVMRTAVEIGLRKFSEETALQMYSEKRLSLSEAADLAELSVGEFMETLVRRGIRQEIPGELLNESLENARKLVRG